MRQTQIHQQNGANLDQYPQSSSSQLGPSSAQYSPAQLPSTLGSSEYGPLSPQFTPQIPSGSHYPTPSISQNQPQLPTMSTQTQPGSQSPQQGIFICLI